MERYANSLHRLEEISEVSRNWSNDIKYPSNPGKFLMILKSGKLLRFNNINIGFV